MSDTHGEKDKPRLFIGLMSGTSMDAVDTVLADFGNPDHPRILAYRQFSIDPDLRTDVRKLNAESSVAEVTRCDYILGELFADSVNRILDHAQVSHQQVEAVGSHGQTILHLPDDPQPRTLQIGDPNLITARTGIATIADFRRMDMAFAGQGAPLAPAFHQRVFGSEHAGRAVLNIGGIANFTLLKAKPDTPILGFDTGPGNGLLDDWNQLHQGTEMDRDSAWAMSGKVQETLLKLFMEDDYFRLPPPKSTGRDYFNLDWVERQLRRLPEEITPADVQATLLQLSIHSIAEGFRREAGSTREIFVCGGGVHNPALLNGLRSQLADVTLASTAELGVDPDAVEALTFAWLAKRTIDRETGSEPGVTGAREPRVLGGLYQTRKLI